jgi:hypothetical protein
VTVGVIGDGVARVLVEVGPWPSSQQPQNLPGVSHDVVADVDDDVVVLASVVVVVVVVLS